MEITPPILQTIEVKIENKNTTEPLECDIYNNAIHQARLNLGRAMDMETEMLFEGASFRQVRLFVSQTGVMPSEAKLRELFPFKFENQYSVIYKSQHQNTVFEWQLIHSMTMKQVKGKKIIIPAGEWAKFVFYLSHRPTINAIGQVK